MSSTNRLHLLLRNTKILPRLPLRRWQSTTPTPPPSSDATKKTFRGQLYDSTARRIVAERVQQSQRSGAGRTSGARPERISISTISGIFVSTTIAIGFYILGTKSHAEPSMSSTQSLADTPAPDHNTSKANMEASWTEFVELLGRENVSTAQGELDRHSKSGWSSWHNEGPTPFMVVFPGSTDDVAGIAKICHARKIPMTPFSGGTSLEGHFAPTRGGVCIDFLRMDKVVALHKEDLDVVVQPAVGWEQLNIDLAPHGLFFPPDPGPGAMIGGMVGTGCSGTNAARWGTMRDWVISLTVVLADGTIIKTRQRPRKSAAGYDLTRLFVGSEGTLGLITEATLKLAVRPPATSVAVAAFPTVADAAQCVADVAAAGTQLAAIELLDSVQMHCINASGSTARTWPEKPTLFLKFSGTPAGVKEQITQVQHLAKKRGSKKFEFARNDAEADELWSARKEALWSVMALKRRDTDKVWTTDVAVPLSSLPSIVSQTQTDIKNSGLLGTIVGHVGDGNFHTILMFSPDEQDIAESLVHRMVKRAIEMNGTASGEHGVGLVKRAYLKEELGQSTVDAMRRVKLAFDPGCLLNCDKVVRMQVGKGH